MKKRFYSLLKWFRFGRWEYCNECLPEKGGYHYWLINNGYANLMPKGKCSHQRRIFNPAQKGLVWIWFWYKCKKEEIQEASRWAWSFNRMDKHRWYQIMRFGFFGVNLYRDKKAKSSV